MALSSLSEGTSGQEVLRDEGGMEVFCNTLMGGPQSDGAMDSVLAIGHMTLKHKENQDSMREAGGLEALKQMLAFVHGEAEVLEMEEATLTALNNMLTENLENQVCRM